ncbi:MAG: hypothetical protein PHE27_04070 [Alphaproteobacteria bacterium]|nr:hypothetical protein [Alphaproteobacteria bacterium]
MTFSLSGNPDTDGIKPLLVSIGNASRNVYYNTFARANTRSNMLYAKMYLLFSISSAATESERTLLFKSLSAAGDRGAVIGNIQIASAVPLPPSAWLFLAALAGFGTFVFLRRRQAA